MQVFVCFRREIGKDILVEIGEIAENRYRLVVEDSGPGIVKSQVPRIFGKLLYGSKFHVLKQSRGQQGIGISAASMYGQLTTGKPTRVGSRTGPKRPAFYYEIQVNTTRNKPEVVRSDEIEWEAELVGYRAEKDEEFRTSSTSPMAGTQYLKSEPAERVWLTREERGFALAYEEPPEASLFVVRSDGAMDPCDPVRRVSWERGCGKRIETQAAGQGPEAGSEARRGRRRRRG